MEPPVKKKSLLAICDKLPFKAVSSPGAETSSDNKAEVTDSDLSGEDLDLSIPEFPQALTEAIHTASGKTRTGTAAKRRKPKTRPVKHIRVIQHVANSTPIAGTETKPITQQDCGFVVQSETGENEIFNESVVESVLEETAVTSNEVCCVDNRGELKKGLDVIGTICIVSQGSEADVTPGKLLAKFRRNPTGRKRGVKKGKDVSEKGDGQVGNCGSPNTKKPRTSERTASSAEKNVCSVISSIQALPGDEVESDNKQTGRKRKKRLVHTDGFRICLKPSQNESLQPSGEGLEYHLPKPALIGADLLSNTDPKDIGPETKEEMCSKGKCLYNSFPSIHLDKGHGVMKRTPFLACRLCKNPYLNTGALLQHLVKKHSVTKDKYVGVHICINSAAQYFRNSDIRSSDLPMEFRGTCWLNQCEYGCCSGSPVTKEQQTLKPVACKVCREAYSSVAGVLQHIEREHDLFLLRHYLHICPDIYRKPKGKPDRGDSAARHASSIRSSEETVAERAEETVVEREKAVAVKAEKGLDKSVADIMAMIPDIVEDIMAETPEVKQKASRRKAEAKKRKSSVDIQKMNHNSTTAIKTGCRVTNSKVTETELVAMVTEGRNQECLTAAGKCRYSCSTKEKLLRSVKMAHIMACKQCRLPYYSIGSFQNHCEVAHTQDKHKVCKYLHICTPTIMLFFGSIKKRAEKEEIKFFRRWYFYDNCHGNTCEFGCSPNHPYACKVCQDTYSTTEEAVQHIEEQHDTVSIKPLLHICPSMLGDPPISPMGDVNKHKAITHHSYVPILNKNAKMNATPIRPIMRRGSRLAVCGEASLHKDTKEDIVKVSYADIGNLQGEGRVSKEVGWANSNMINMSREASSALEYGDDNHLFNREYGKVKVKLEPHSEEYESAEQLGFTIKKTEDRNEWTAGIREELGLLTYIKSEPEFEFSTSGEQFLNTSLNNSS